MIRSFDEDDDDSFRHTNQPQKERCSCRSIIDSLYEKLRYNEIQIDILKRVKASGESCRHENEKLKKQNANLYSRVEYLADLKKQKKKRKKSDSSLELSLTPKKGRK